MKTGEELGGEWLDAMMAGEFGRAWRVNDEIRALELPDPHRFWLGEDFAGKRVLVRCLHGFGDSLQFLRYLPLLNARAESVCVEVGPRFAELARCLRGAGEVIVWGDAEPAWDVQMEVMELAYVFRTELWELPVAERYLSVSAAAGEAQGGLLRVGLMWQAGEWNAARGSPFGELEPLLGVTGCEFWNLSHGPVPDERLREDEGARASLLGLARRVAGLDLVITVDTVTAHLAGALGVPAWVMLQHEADWRWMRGRADSPWYPSLRLFRQGEAQGWEQVVAEIAAALRALTEGV